MNLLIDLLISDSIIFFNSFSVPVILLTIGGLFGYAISKALVP